MPRTTVHELLEALPTAALVVRLGGTIEHANRAAAQLLDVKSDMLVGAMLPDLLGGATLTRALTNVAEGHDDVPTRVQLAPGRRPGPRVCLEALPRALHGRSDAVLLLLEPTKSPKPGAGGLEGASRLELVLDAGHVGVWELDVSSGRLAWSRRCVEITGLESFDGTVEDFLRHVHPEDVPCLRGRFDAAIRDEAPFESEFRLYRPDGELRWIAHLGRPSWDRRGRLVAFTGTVRDVSAARRAQDEIEASEVRFRQLADAIHEVFFLVEPGSRRVVYVSAAYEKIWGKSCHSLIDSPQDWMLAIHEDDRASVHEALCRPEVEHELEYRIFRPDRTMRFIRARSSPVRDARGEVVRVAGVAEDITDRKALEEQLRHTQRMESIGRLAAGVAHDFNNWLTVILAAGHMLEQHGGHAPEDAELLSDIVQAARRATLLTRQLLTFVRSDMPAPRLLDLNGVVRDMEKALLRVLGQNILISTRLASDIHAVRMDPGHLSQVLMNLAVNARDAMPAGGTLAIATHQVRPGGSGPLTNRAGVCLTVSDTGLGMSPEVRARIFEPFFTTKVDGRGTGLGLSVVHGIIEQSGGSIEVESEPGQGTTFRVFLPSASGDPAEGNIRPTPLPLAANTTILLVEDEALVRRVAFRGLVEAGHTVLVAADGEQALLVLKRHTGPLDLVVTDVMLPGISGRELAARIHAVRPDLPVLFASGYTDDARFKDGVQQREVCFIQKPYTVDELVRAASQAMAQGSDS